MELITRQGSRRLRHSLETCVEELWRRGKIDNETWRAFTRIKETGKDLCKATKGYGILDQLPLSVELEEYAINDVALMPQLFDYYFKDL